MRNFGTLGGRVSRGLRTQAVLRNYPSPLYLQTNTGYPYGTYGDPGTNPNKTSMFYAEQYNERETNKYDAWSSGLTGLFDVGGKVVEGQYALKGAAIGADAAQYTSGGTSGGSGSTGLIIGLTAVALVIGVGTFMVLR